MSETAHDPTMRLFIVCASVLVLKMLATGYLTSVLRNLRKVYVTPEDYAFLGREPGPPDPQIERVRRAHRNDLEEILPFLAVGYLAAATGAVRGSLAAALFVTFTIARLLHTAAYSLGWQPWRSILFGIGDAALLFLTLLLLVRSVG